MGYVLYLNFQDADKLNEFKLTFLDSWRESNPLLLLLIIMLMPLNWLAETKRFQLLISPFVKLRFVQSLLSIVSGLTFAVISPNRIGEYAGRIVKLDAKHNKYGLIATLVGSISQNFVNLSAGLLGALYVFGRADILLFEQEELFYGITILFISLLIGLYYRLDILAKWMLLLPDNKYIERLKKAAGYLVEYSNKMLTINMLWSIVRYLIYMSQYVLMLWFFGIELDLLLAMSGVALIYLIQSGLPLPPMIGILARGEIAVLVWGQFTDNVLGILAATFSLWIINLIVPSFLGLSVLLKTDLIKSLGLYEKSQK